VIRGFWKSSRDAAERTAQGPRYNLFVSFREGMQELVDKMMTFVDPKVVHLNTRVLKIERNDTGSCWRIVFETGEEVEALKVVVTASARETARILGEFSHDLAYHLQHIPYESVITLHFAYDRSAIRHALDGFGFVVPQIENSILMGCSFPSVKFEGRAPKDKVLIRAFVGGFAGHRFLKLDDRDLADRVESELKGYLFIQGQSLFCDIARHPHAMPQYAIGHELLVERIQEETLKYSGLFLLGNAYHGVGITDCLCRAEDCAKQILNEIKEIKV